MLKIGSPAPDFVLSDQNGKTVRLSDLLATSNVVIFFYPKDHTTGCTMQSCSFRDNYDGFAKQNTKIIGISSDSNDSHNNFAKSHSLPFSLLSDTDGKVRKLYQVGKTFGLLPGRATFVIDQSGIVRFAISSQFQIQRHIDDTLQFVQSL